MTVNDSGRPEGITRREALKRGAAIAGAVWAVPAMQMLNMSAANADDGPDSGVSNPSVVSSDES